LYKDLSDNGLRFYKEDIAEIQKIMRKEKLPIMNVKEGWEPLCTILGEKGTRLEVPESRWQTVLWKEQCRNGEDFE
jgi:hypothetical protein